MIISLQTVTVTVLYGFGKSLMVKFILVWSGMVSYRYRMEFFRPYGSFKVLNGLGHGKSNMVFYGMYDLVWS